MVKSDGDIGLLLHAAVLPSQIPISLIIERVSVGGGPNELLYTNPLDGNILSLARFLDLCYS